MAIINNGAKAITIAMALDKVYQYQEKILYWFIFFPLDFFPYCFDMAMAMTIA